MQPITEYIFKLKPGVLEFRRAIFVTFYKRNAK